MLIINSRGTGYLRWKLSLIDIILLAIALGIDCLLVSFSQGLMLRGKKTVNSFKLALTMGLFQGLMPCIGYTGTNYIYELVEPYSKWVAFGIFFVLGMKFILEAFETAKEEICCIEFRCLISLGVATSIDALVAGANLNLLHTPLLNATVLIGLVSFFMSLVGFWFGNFLKKFNKKYLEVTGGIILIFLALKSIITIF